MESQGTAANGFDFSASITAIVGRWAACQGGAAGGVAGQSLSWVAVAPVNAIEGVASRTKFARLCGDCVPEASAASAGEIARPTATLVVDAAVCAGTSAIYSSPMPFYPKLTQAGTFNLQAVTTSHCYNPIDEPWALSAPLCGSRGRMRFPASSARHLQTGSDDESLLVFANMTIAWLSIRRSQEGEALKNN